MTNHIFGNKQFYGQIKSFQKTSLVFSAGNHDSIRCLNKTAVSSNYRYKINSNFSLLMHYRSKKSSLMTGNGNVTYKAVLKYCNKLKPLVKQALITIF